MRDKKQTILATVVTALVLSAPSVFAQARGVASAAANTAASVANAAAAAGAMGAAHANATNAGAVGAANAAGAASHAAGAVNAAAAATTHLPNGGASANYGVAARAEAPGVGIAAEKSVAASAALDLTASLHTIHETTFEARQQLLSNMHARVEASADTMKDISAQAREMRGAARTEFKAALSDMQDAKKALEESMEAAEKAEASGWSEARADLEKRYDGYVRAVARAEARSTAHAPGG
jgi:hypothetical protein